MESLEKVIAIRGIIRGILDIVRDMSFKGQKGYGLIEVENWSSNSLLPKIKILNNEMVRTVINSYEIISLFE